MIRTVVCKSRPGQSTCQLGVSTVGAVLSVAAGTCRFGKTSFVLAEDETYTLVPSAVGREVEGHLVLVNGEGRLFIFEHATDGSGLFFDDTKFPGMTFLHQLFSMRIPANAADFDAIEIAVIHIVETEDPKPRGNNDGS